MKFNTALKLLCLSLAMGPASGCKCIGLNCGGFSETDGIAVCNDSCNKGETISGCESVTCVGKFSCDGAWITVTESITCNQLTCRNTLLSAKTVTCNDKACRSATITANEEITCSGSESCRGIDIQSESTKLTAPKVTCNNGACRGGEVTITSPCLECSGAGSTCGTYSAYGNCQWTPDGQTTTVDCDSPNVNTCPPKDAGAFDDPHFLTFGGQYYDFMGECDLMLIQVNQFWNGLPLTIAVRTQIRYSYSYITSAVISIGEDKFQASSFGQWFLNGIYSGDVAMGIAGFPITHSQPSTKLSLFEIDLGGGESIKIRSYKDMVSLKLHTAKANSKFAESVGMMGEFPTGRLLGRNGTEIPDGNPMLVAQEWQVRDDEPMLFQISRPPQYPQACLLPSSDSDGKMSVKPRRLGEATVTLEMAEEACAGSTMMDACIHDVLATGDLELATDGAVW